jgi:hypothetical protein
LTQKRQEKLTHPLRSSTLVLKFDTGGSHDKEWYH